MAKVSKVGIYGGIDPGQSGGFAAINGKVINYYPMPETDLEIHATIKELYAEAAHVFLEKVSSSPQMGVASAFTFGKGFGGLEMALTALEIPYTLVTPQRWQGALGIPKKTKEQKQAEHKEKLRVTAQKLFPKLDAWKGTLGLQRSICDALLIAQFCQLTYR